MKSGLQHRIKPDWPQRLKDILDRAASVGPSAVLAFDLDSTVFDNRPRQARIVREFGAFAQLPQLSRCAPEYFDSGWNLSAALRNCGLAKEDIKRVKPELRKFWFERFFTSAYCIEDVAVKGAMDFLLAAVRTGATVCYVTGRHEGMREGTLVAMRRCGFPLPGGLTRLIMKPDPQLGDDEFKRQAHAELARIGRVIAAFENEPMHANDYLCTFPQATVFHLATDHSGRPVELLEAIVSLPSFA